MSDSPAAPRRALRIWVRRLAPWVITAAVVAYILREYSVAKIVDEMQRGDVLPMVPLAALVSAAVLVVISSMDYLVIRGFLGRPRWPDVLRGKGALSMLLTLGYGFGHGGYAVWIARVTGATLGRTAGVALYIAAADLCALSTVATATIYLGGADVPRVLAIAAPAVAGTLLVLAMLGPFRLLGEVPSIFKPWSELSRKRQLATIAGRAANIWAMVSVTWLAAQAFGLDVPYAVMTAYLPLIILVGSMPINVAGLGPVQGAWLIFEPWAAGTTILAFQFLWQLMLGAGLVLRGLPFIRRALKEIEEGKVLDA